MMGQLRDLVPDLVERLRGIARRGGAAPTNEDIAEWYGFASPASGSDLVRRAEQRGLIRVHRGPMQRVIEAADFSWKTEGEIREPHFTRAQVTKDSDWTVERVAKLRALVAEGHTFEEIGRRLGATKNAVVGKASRLKLVKQKPDERKKHVAVKRPPAPLRPTSRFWEAPPAPRERVAPTLRAKASPHRACQWITSAEDAPLEMCGAAVLRPGCSWCAAHYARVFRPDQPAAIAA